MGGIFKIAAKALPAVSKTAGTTARTAGTAASTAARTTASAPARAMSAAPRNGLPGKAVGMLKQTAMDAAKMTPQGQAAELALDIFQAAKQRRAGASMKDVATGLVEKRIEGAVTDAVGAGGAGLLERVASKATGAAHDPNQPKHHRL